MTTQLERLDAALGRADDALARGRKWPFLLFLFAFFLKLIYVIQSSDALFVAVPLLDARIYDATAQYINAGRLIGQEAFFMGPLYPYVLSVIYSVFGRDFTVVRVVQSLGGAATVMITFLLGRMLFRPSVAFAGALMLTLYGAVTFYDGLLLMAWLGTLLNLGALTILVKAARTRRNVTFAVAGALIGLSALARANILVLVPVVVVWIVWILRERRRWIGASVFTGAAIAMLLPAIVHNYVVSREFIPVTSNAGLNFYLGNNSRATGYFSILPEIDVVHDPTTALYVKRLTGEALRPGELSRYWFRKAVAEISESPGRAAVLMAKKFAMFWNGYEAPQMESYSAARAQYGSLRLLFVRFWWIVALAALGMLVPMGRARERWLLYSFLGAYSLSIVLFFITSRYRVQIAPVMCLFAAHGVLVFVTQGLRSARRAGLLATTLVAVLLATHPRLFAMDDKVVHYHEAVHDARRLSELGRYQPALEAVDRAIEQLPDAAEGYIHRAIIHKAAHNELKAIEDYARALELRPGLAGTHYDLAQSLRRMNYPEEAIKEYRKAIEISPGMIQAHNNLGIAYRDLGMYEEAARAFRAAIEIDPKYVKAYNNLGASLAEAGRVDEAIDVLEEAKRAVPDYPNTHKNLAMAYVSLKRPEPAIEAMTRYLELVPDDTSAREILNKLYEAVATDTTTVEDG